MASVLMPDPDATTPDPAAPTTSATPDPTDASPASPAEPAQRRKRRVWLWLTVPLVVIVLIFGGVVGGVLVMWPHAQLVPDEAALGRIVLPDYAGWIGVADVRTPDGLVPIEQRGERSGPRAPWPPASR